MAEKFFDPIATELIDLSSKTNRYLGSFETVNEIFRLEIYQATQQDFKETTLVEVSSKIAEIFLGLNKEYSVVPGWNTPGGIDAFLRSQLPIEETVPQDVVSHAFLILIDELLEYDNEATGALPEQVSEGYDSIVSRFCDLFVGISPSLRLVSSS